MSLPTEIVLYEILPLVPAKSLIRFRCVCKLWCNTIASSPFITTHLNRCKSTPPGSIILPFGNDYTYCNNSTGEHFNLRLNKILNDNNHLIPITSSDGLLVIQSLNTSSISSVPFFYVCNPITRQFTKLPQPPYWLSSCEIVYDSTNSLYKVVSWSSVKGCAIFTLSDGEMGSWRLVDLPEGCGDICSRAVSVNGALNWVAEIKKSNKTSILSMDIAQEKIARIELPIIDEKPITMPILKELMGSMYVVFPSDNLYETSIWVLNTGCQWNKVSKNTSSGSNYSVISSMAPNNRSSSPRSGLHPVHEDDKCGSFSYSIHHVNSLVSWNDTPFEHHSSWKKLHLATALKGLSRSLFARLWM